MVSGIPHIPGISVTGLGITVVTTFVRWRCPRMPHYLSGPGIAVGAGIIIMSFFPALRIGTLTAGLAGLGLLVFAVEWQLTKPVQAAGPPLVPPSSAPPGKPPPPPLPTLAGNPHMPSAPKAPNPSPQSSAHSTVSVTDSPGSIIAPSGGNNTVNNYGAPPPRLELVSAVQFIGKHDERTYQWACTIRVTGTPDNVVVAVRGTSVKDTNVNPLDQGTANTGSWSALDVQYMKVSSPKGRYQIVINTSSDTEPDVQFGINQ